MQAFIPPDLWPANSPDLNPVDYRIWCVVQQQVYQSRVHDIDELKQRLQQVWRDIDQSIIDNAIDEWRVIVHAGRQTADTSSICCRRQYACVHPTIWQHKRSNQNNFLWMDRWPYVRMGKQTLRLALLSQIRWVDLNHKQQKIRKTKLRWFSRLLRHSTRNWDGLILQCSRAHTVLSFHKLKTSRCSSY